MTLSKDSIVLATLVLALVHPIALGQITSQDGDRAPVRMGIAPTELTADPVDHPDAWPTGATVRLEALDTTLLLAEDELSDKQPGLPFRTGVVRPLLENSVSSESDGIWSQTDEGHVWRLKIVAPGAKAIRVHFSSIAIAEGDHVVLANRTGAAAHVYGARHVGKDAFWSAPLVLDQACLEC